MAGISEEAATLSSKPTRANWERFARSLRESKAAFYSIRYSGGKISSKEDLRDAYAQIYDSKEKPIARVPVVIEDGKRIKGATIYLKGLLNLNKA